MRQPPSTRASYARRRGAGDGFLLLGHYRLTCCRMRACKITGLYQYGPMFLYELLALMWCLLFEYGAIHPTLDLSTPYSLLTVALGFLLGIFVELANKRYMSGFKNFKALLDEASQLFWEVVTRANAPGSKRTRDEMRKSIAEIHAILKAVPGLLVFLFLSPTEDAAEVEQTLERFDARNGGSALTAPGKPARFIETRLDAEVLGDFDEAPAVYAVKVVMGSRAVDNFARMCMHLGDEINAVLGGDDSVNVQLVWPHMERMLSYFNRLETMNSIDVSPHVTEIMRIMLFFYLGFFAFLVWDTLGWWTMLLQFVTVYFFHSEYFLGKHLREPIQDVHANPLFAKTNPVTMALPFWDNLHQTAEHYGFSDEAYAPFSRYTDQ